MTTNKSVVCVIVLASYTDVLLMTMPLKKKKNVNNRSLLQFLSFGEFGSSNSSLANKVGENTQNIAYIPNPQISGTQFRAYHLFIVRLGHRWSSSPLLS